MSFPQCDIKLREQEAKTDICGRECEREKASRREAPVNVVNR